MTVGQSQTDIKNARSRYGQSQSRGDLAIDSLKSASDKVHEGISSLVNKLSGQKSSLANELERYLCLYSFQSAQSIEYASPHMGNTRTLYWNQAAGILRNSFARLYLNQSGYDDLKDERLKEVIHTIRPVIARFKRPVVVSGISNMALPAIDFPIYGLEEGKAARLVADPNVDIIIDKIEVREAVPSFLLRPESEIDQSKNPMYEWPFVDWDIEIGPNVAKRLFPNLDTTIGFRGNSGFSLTYVPNYVPVQRKPTIEITIGSQKVPRYII
jgi:hypothetical protein